MREKQLWLLITFSTTASAMALEEAFHAAGLPGRLIPVPTNITAECGLAWRAPLSSRQAAEALIARQCLSTAGLCQILL